MRIRFARLAAIVATIALAASGFIGGHHASVLAKGDSDGVFSSL